MTTVAAHPAVPGWAASPPAVSEHPGAVRVRVDSCLRLDRGQIPPKLEAWLERELSLPNPAYVERVRLGLSTAGEPPVLCFAEADGDLLVLPRGAIHRLRRLAAAAGLDVACEDHRLVPVERLPELAPPALRDYQRAAVEAFTAATQGVVVIPCGGGKTRVALGVIARLRTPALVLVHTRDLAQQWREQLREVLGVEAGLVGEGQTQLAPVAVALVQALAPMAPAALDGLLGGFGLVILDEAHHVAATTFRGVVGRAPARYRLGLTATPERADGLTALLELYLGQTVATASHEELVSAGVLAVPEVRTVETAFTFPYQGADDYGPMLEAIVDDGPRNDLVADAVAAEALAGHTCLLLTGRVRHCELLLGLLEARGVGGALLTGGVPPSDRRRRVEAARDGSLPVLLTAGLADEGLDLPRLSRVFLAFPSRARGRTLQRLGRLMRIHPEKTDSVLFDFVDRRVPVLRRHHVERRRLYAEVLGVTASELRGQFGQVRE